MKASDAVMQPPVSLPGLIVGQTLRIALVSAETQVLHALAEVIAREEASPARQEEPPLDRGGDATSADPTAA
jgi:hypothetical protein